ncbi:MAG: polya polymerase [Desulfobacteraceae bacterium 4572_130]|nr:MAG: polya polymerase [Desulfobacteraceae bacterium 4572_130]
MRKKEKIKVDTIITSHSNVDFDALASMLAAQKLYPGAVVIFPGSQEKTLRDFFVSSMSYLFNMADLKTVDFSYVKKLVLVDTKQKTRVPHVKELINKHDIKIHIYDHHPLIDNDILGDFELIRFYGSCVTILSGIIKEKKIKLNPEEATIMALGIYEDTGSFTYSSTTEQDFIEASYLLSCGANLNTIASIIVKEITSNQVLWINKLLKEITCHKINGFNINISIISSSSYIMNLASIVQKVVQMEKFDVLFAIVLMENKIHIIARSKSNEVDTGKILSFFGGGGHYYAGSAKISNKTLVQVEQKLLEIIKKQVKPVEIVKKLISSPAITINPDVPCKKASEIMTRYNINCLIVAHENNIKGYITRQVIEKILFHNLGHLFVKEYMTNEITTITFQASLSEIENKIIDKKQRILPVIKNNNIAGIITRTDLLSFLFQQNKLAQFNEENINAPGHAKQKNINYFINERLDNKIIELLKSLGKTGDDMKINVFVIGGFVRDLVLYKAVDDIDIVVEGDGIAFARKFADKKNARYNAHKKFGTAVIILSNGIKIDVASARLEYYKFPAALPTVEMSSIKLDLFRRDFTINTLAISLNENEFGNLIDFFGAQRDIKDKTIRILHNLSFVEDPTRIFRAIKFANRYDFTIGKLTSSLIKNAIKIDLFKKISGLRVLSELKQILEEENPIPAIKTLQQYNLEKAIHPDFIIDREIINLMENVKKVLSWHDLLFLNKKYLRWSVYFMVMVKKCSNRVIADICIRLKIPPKQKKIIQRHRLKADQCLELMEKNLPTNNSRLYALVSIFKTELILYIMACAKNKATKKAVSYFYTHLKDTEIYIRGRDLINLKIKPGIEYKEILQKVMDARLNGHVKTFKDEIEFVTQYIKKQKT